MLSKSASRFALAGVAGLVLMGTVNSSNAYTGDNTYSTIVRDHRALDAPIVRDHRRPVVRDHRGGGGSPAGGVTVTSGQGKSRGTSHKTCGRLVFGGPTVCVSY